MPKVGVESHLPLLSMPEPGAAALSWHGEVVNAERPTLRVAILVYRRHYSVGASVGEDDVKREAKLHRLLRSSRELWRASDVDLALHLEERRRVLILDKERQRMRLVGRRPGHSHGNADAQMAQCRSVGRQHSAVLRPACAA